MVELDHEIHSMAQHDPVAKRLQQLRGVRPLIATALVAAVGNAEQFANGRQMAASLGLTPKQHSSGGKDRLPGISKRGNVYLGSLLIYGARPVVWAAWFRKEVYKKWHVSAMSVRRDKAASSSG